MGLTSTLYSGISGLQANSEAMSVTGNNISNSNTVGFKSSSTVFSDMLSASLASASGNSQVGRGVEIQSVAMDFSQGSFQSTGSATDLAIEGDGFFMLQSPSGGESYYTRNGAFQFDSSGYLVNAEGLQVLGKPYDTGGNLTAGDPQEIQIDLTSLVPAQQTANVTLTTNLNSTSSIVGPFDITDPVATSNYSTSTQVYDSLGNTHLVTTYFTKTSGQNWEWNSVCDSSELDPSMAGPNAQTLIGNGTLAFDSTGNLTSGGTGSSSALLWTSGAASQTLDFDFDTTQFNSTSVVIAQSQDGYGPGEVVSVDVGTDGTVSAVYSNGETIPVAMVTLATFNNPDGLDSMGGSLFSATTESGAATVGVPGASQGNLFTQSLELSNVDLSQEFVDMITIQNGYSAASRVITTTDEMLQELLNLKR